MVIEDVDVSSDGFSKSLNNYSTTRLASRQVVISILSWYFLLVIKFYCAYLDSSSYKFDFHRDM